MLKKTCALEIQETNCFMFKVLSCVVPGNDALVATPNATVMHKLGDLQA